jgi:hypothetical protein
LAETDLLNGEQLKEEYEAFVKNFVCDKLPEDNVENNISEYIERKDALSFHSVNGWSLVGHGKVTNPDEGKNQCGKFYGQHFCDHVEKHKGIVTLDGHDHTGQVYLHKRFRWCNNPRCPTCYKNGWAKREAANIEERIHAAERLFNEMAEHTMVSVPSVDFGLSYEALRSKVRKILDARNVHGGCLIFHGFRYHHANETYEGEPAHWFWSRHFHCIGFIRKGYSQCRRCDNHYGIGRVRFTDRCLRCNGFEGVTRRCYLGTEGKKGDNYIVKVAGKRRSIFHTAWYQLDHASLKEDVKRFQIVTWFGTCSYHKLKYHKVARKSLYTCPLCFEDLKPCVFVGAAGTNPLNVIGVKECWDDLYDERGMARWISKATIFSGSYG